MTSQYWFRQWIGAVRHQAITWANVDPDPCRHMASLGRNELTHCGTGMPHGIRDLLSSLFQIMACSLFSTKPLPEPVVTYCQLDPQEHISMKYNLKFKHFHSWKYVCSGLSVLTHWGQVKWQTLCRQHFQMDFVCADNIFKRILLNEMFCILIQMGFVPDITSTSVHAFTFHNYVAILCHLTTMI